MYADQRLETFCQTDETNCQSTVLDYFFDGIVRSKFFGVEPNALSHQEREVSHFFLRLNLKAFHQLPHRKIDHIV